MIPPILFQNYPSQQLAILAHHIQLKNVISLFIYRPNAKHGRRGSAAPNNTPRFLLFKIAQTAPAFHIWSGHTSTL